MVLMVRRVKERLALIHALATVSVRPSSPLRDLMVTTFTSSGIGNLRWDVIVTLDTSVLTVRNVNVSTELIHCTSMTPVL